MKNFGLMAFLSIIFVVSCESNKTKTDNSIHEESVLHETIALDSVYVTCDKLKHPSEATVDNLLQSGIPFPDFKDFVAYNSEENLSSYFFEIDFNNDGAMDIIYEGPSGAESNSVIFYLNKNGKFEEFFSEFHHLEQLIFVDQILNTINMIEPGCCTDHAYLQKQTHFIYVNGKFHNERIKTICSYGEPELKHKFHTPKDIDINATPYLLRYSPELDNDTFFYATKENEIPEWLIIGNQLGKLKKGDRGLAIAYEKDDTGREWWFVIFSKDVRPTDNYFDYIITPENANLQFSGWVSKKNILVIGNP